MSDSRSITIQLPKSHTVIMLLGTIIVEMGELEFWINDLLGRLLNNPILAMNLTAKKRGDSVIKFLEAAFYTSKRGEVSTERFKTLCTHIRNLYTDRDEYIHRQWFFSDQLDKATSLRISAPSLPGKMNINTKPSPTTDDLKAFVLAIQKLTMRVAEFSENFFPLTELPVKKKSN